MNREYNGGHDFDFFHGRWQLRNERLKQRLAGSGEWEVFAATTECRPILDGFGNIDDFVTDWGRPGSREPFVGMSLRLFNAATGEWSIYWAGNHDGVLEAPMVGRFGNDPAGDRTGTFSGTLQHEGRPVRAKFTWDQISANAAHWHQAFSADEGRTWETNWHMWMRRVDERGRLVHDDAVIELRQYTMNPGARDTLVELFEREFIEPQEAVGMHVIGQFRDLDEADRYVWMRGFPSMPARRDALQSFYFGPVWLQHREAANATLLDNDDVLLLKPARPGSGFAPVAETRAATGSTAAVSTAFCAGICALGAPAQDHFVEVFERTLAPLLEATGATLLATYVTDPSANTFPRLPVREGEQVFVWFARFEDAAALDRHLAALPDDTQWRKAIADALFGELREPPKLLRLAPTPRSELR